MASTTQKKTTKTNTRSKKTTKSTQKRPVRREVGAGICLVLALLVFAGYLGSKAVVLDWLAVAVKCLVGCGYYLMGPALLLAGVILLFHHGHPVVLRMTCALLLPLFFGMLWQEFLLKGDLQTTGIIGTMWQMGKALQGGGVLSGTLAFFMVKLLSKPVSIILTMVLLIICLMVATRLDMGAILKKHRERVRYEEEPEEEVVMPIHPVKAAPKRSRIDIPLDGDEIPAVKAETKKEEKSGKFTGFFRHKSDDQKTPGQVLEEHNRPERVASPVKPVTPAIPAVPSVMQTEEPAVVSGTVESVIRNAPAAASFEQIPAAPVAASAPAAAAPVSASVPAAEESPRSEKARAAKEVAAEAAAVTAEIEQKMAASEESYQFPPITLLHQNQGENHIQAGAELRNNARRLAETLSSFGVDAKAGDVVHGPSVTRYEFTLDQGVKLSKITNLADDIALALGASGVRIAPIPDKISVVGIEVPNKQVTPVLIRDVIESREFVEHSSKVAFALGRDIAGRNIIGNIEKLPHVLIAGTTGSGKSVCTNSLIISLLYKSTPDEVRFIMVDPKMVELAPYNGIPHLLIPVVTDPKKAAGALQWAVFEMMKRYKTFSENGVKKLEEFNKLAKVREGLEPLPSVVVVIDELADLMLVAAKEVEESICRVAQMGRAAGVHLVIATQRPSADVITGLMKANIPSRIAFAVASSLESRIILDNSGAEKLVGRGDMLYAPLGEGKPARVQGCFISPEEIEEVVNFVKQSGEANYSDEVIAKIEESVQEKDKGSAKSAAPVESSGDDGDELLPAAVEVVLETGQASVSMLQRRLKLGYSRAARLVDQMEERGIVGPFEGSKPRQLLITKAQWQEMQMGGADEIASDEPPFDVTEE